MKIVNRRVLLVSKKRPFLTWTKRLPKADLKLTLASLNVKPSCYLISDSMSETDILKFIKDNYEQIFRTELTRWWPVLEHWEPELTWQKFNMWFSYEIGTEPIDIEDGELLKFQLK